MRKNLHDRILKMELKEQHLSIISKFCSLRKRKVYAKKLFIIGLKALENKFINEINVHNSSR